MVLLFHELGHAIHDIVSNTQYARFHGTNVTVDFGEAPSQMLENWCWEPSVLKSLSKHYTYLSTTFRTAWEEQAGGAAQPAETISDAMIDSLVSSRRVTFGALFYLRQLHFAMFDMLVHQPTLDRPIESLDLAKEWNNLRSRTCLCDGPEVLGCGDGWGHGYAHFRHLVGDDYDAGYYSYLL